MTNLSPTAVICLAIGLVLAINGVLVLGLARGRLQRQADLLRRAARAAQNPWKQEQEALGELHRRVGRLSGGPPGDSD